MKRKYRLERLNNETGKWEFVLLTRNKNYPCCSRFERVV